MLHQNLAVSEIRKLTDEAKNLDTAHDVLGDVLGKINELIVRRFNGNRKLTGEQLKTVFENCKSIFTDHIQPIESDFKEYPATRIHPKGEAYEATYVAAKRTKEEIPYFGHPYQLFTFRMYASRKLVRFEVDHLPVAFTYHAAERYMERAQGIDKAFFGLARELADWSVFLKHAEVTAGQRAKGFMAVPMMDGAGMLLGEYAMNSHSPMCVIEHNRDASTTKIREPDPEDSNLFVVRTFVDRFKFRPNQSYSMKVIADWRETYAEDYTRARDSLVWPDRAEDPEALELGIKCEDDLYTLLRNPVLLRTMHPDIAVNRTRQSDYHLPGGRWAASV